MNEDQRSEPGSAQVQPQEMPAELLLRHDRTTRYERGARVYATDGLVGSLRQVVVNQAAGEVMALVVAVRGMARVVLMPVDLVDRTAGSAVILRMNRAQFLSRLPQAPEYDKSRFVKVGAKALLGKARASSGGSPRRLVARAGRHFIETAVVSSNDQAVPDRGLQAKGVA